MANKFFENSLNRISQPTPPIWFMRQAGRYHSHYNKLKEKYTFEQLCKHPELASEVACGPIQEFDFDVAILFSDILFPLEGLGIPLKFSPGPIFGEFIRQDNYQQYADIDKAIEHMEFQRNAITLTREKLPKNKSLIGSADYVVIVSLGFTLHPHTLGLWLIIACAIPLISIASHKKVWAKKIPFIPYLTASWLLVSTLN